MNKLNWQQLPDIDAGGVEQSVPEHIEDLYDLIESSEMEFPVPEFSDDILYSAESSEGLVWNEVNFKEKLDEVLYKLKGEQLFKGAVTQIEIEGQPWYNLGDDIDLENNKFYLHIIQIPYSDDTFDWYVYLCRSVETVEDGLHLRALSVSSNEGFDFLEEPSLISKYYNDALVSRVGSLTGINSLYQINDVDISDYSDIVTILELYFDSLVKHIPDLVGGTYLPIDQAYEIIESSESEPTIDYLYLGKAKVGNFILTNSDEYSDLTEVINNLSGSMGTVKVGIAYTSDPNGFPNDEVPSFDTIDIDNVETFTSEAYGTHKIYFSPESTIYMSDSIQSDPDITWDYPCETSDKFHFKVLNPGIGVGGQLYINNTNGSISHTGSGWIYLAIYRETTHPGSHEVIVHDEFGEAVETVLNDTDLFYKLKESKVADVDINYRTLRNTGSYGSVTLSDGNIIIPVSPAFNLDQNVYEKYLVSVSSIVDDWDSEKPVIQGYGKNYSYWWQENNEYTAKFSVGSMTSTIFRTNSNGTCLKIKFEEWVNGQSWLGDRWDQVTDRICVYKVNEKDLDKFADMTLYTMLARLVDRGELTSNLDSLRRTIPAPLYHYFNNYIDEAGYSYLNQVSQPEQGSDWYSNLYYIQYSLEMIRGGYTHDGLSEYRNLGDTDTIIMVETVNDDPNDWYTSRLSSIKDILTGELIVGIPTEQVNGHTIDYTCRWVELTSIFNPDKKYFLFKDSSDSHGYYVPHESLFLTEYGSELYDTPHDYYDSIITDWRQYSAELISSTEAGRSGGDMGPYDRTYMHADMISAFVSLYKSQRNAAQQEITVVPFIFDVNDATSVVGNTYTFWIDGADTVDSFNTTYWFNGVRTFNGARIIAVDPVTNDWTIELTLDAPMTSTDSFAVEIWKR